MIAGCCALEMFPGLGVPVRDFLMVDFWQGVEPNLNPNRKPE